MVTIYPPDLGKIENLLKRLVNKNSTEEKVLQRYIQLAGLVRNGEMVNRDKEARARQWVAEQEQKEREEKARKKWWEQTWVQLTMLLGAIAGIISLFFILK